MTGRKHFQNVLKTYVNNWLEHGIIQNARIRLHLFVAYDLKYFNTQAKDYKNIPPEVAGMIDSINFYGTSEVEQEVALVGSSGRDLGWGRGRKICLWRELCQKKEPHHLFRHQKSNGQTPVPG